MLALDTGRAMRAIRLLEAAQRFGLDSEELRELVGIEPDQIDDPDKRVPSSQVLALWRLLAQRLPDPDLGLEVGTHGDVRQGGVLGYAVLHSQDLGRALRRIARFSRLLSTTFDVGLEEAPDVWRLASRRPPSRPGFRAPTDEALASIVTVFRQITGRKIDPVEVRLPYARPDDLSKLRQVFRSDLRFDAPRDALAFRARDMARPLVKAEAKLAEYLDRLAEQDVAALPRSDTYARRVGRLAWHQLPEGQPTIGVVAREIGVSSRTLQRRLAVYEIAYLLGYADPSAFFRAFRRWHGHSPAKHRLLAT